MIEFTYSTKGRSCGGRWYPRPDRISIFLNIAKQCLHQDETELDMLWFIAYLCAIEFHELGHVHGFRGGCNKPDECRSGGCFWCNQVQCVHEILYDGMVKP